MNFTECIKFESHSKLPLKFTEVLKSLIFTELLVISTADYNLAYKTGHGWIMSKNILDMMILY